MKISVIIPTKNRYSDLLACVHSLMGQTVLPDEIIVVDASDSYQLQDILAATFSNDPKIRYIHASPGLTHQRNVGVSAATGDILFFFDDDIVLDRIFVREISKIFEGDPDKKIGGVYGNIVDSLDNDREKVPGNLKKEILTLGYSFFASVFFLSKVRKDGKFQPNGFPTYPYGSQNVTVVECVPGGLTAYRKEVFQDLSFDENLTGYGYMEDDDFSYRVAQKFKNVYTPYAKVVHNESPAARDRRFESRKMMMMNYWYLFKKNIPQDFWRQVVFWWSVLGLVLNEVVTFNFAGLRGLIDGLRHRGEPFRKE
jgi:GT2 family glycosyltransferase